MGFRTSSNEHDEWRSFTAEHRELIDATNLPLALFRTESVFTSFLDTGHSSDSELVLASLPNEQFLALESVVNKWFFDGWRQKSLAALARHRLQKFGRFA